MLKSYFVIVRRGVLEYYHKHLLHLYCGLGLRTSNQTRLALSLSMDSYFPAAFRPH